jgi:predicted ABC-class ATPase
MPDARSLSQLLHSIDGRGYGAYKQLGGRSFDLDTCTVAIDHVQTDPFAPPSLVRVIVGRDRAGLPEDLIDDRPGLIATEDFLTRACAAVLTGEGGPGRDGDITRHGESGRDGQGGHGRGGRPGSGNSGSVSIGHPGQEILERTSVLITEDRIEARLSVGLPAAGRRVRGRDADRLLTRTLPDLAARALVHAALDAEALRAHVRLHRDQEDLRSQLAGRGLVAFVADGATLPRASGASDTPLASGGVPFTGPTSLQVTFTLRSGGTVSGMAVPEGVTVIVGGGFHGKSTLLRALVRGVYAHVAGDGREWVLTRPDAMAIRAEDGRAVTDVDISPLIGNLPTGADTRRFTTTNASGSTSQATNLVEALEARASALLIDEDTSATNFMIRDARMRELVPGPKEPITPFVDRVRDLYDVQGVSTILVAGGSGAFFDVADHVIAMDAYVPADVTARAREIASHLPADGSTRDARADDEGADGGGGRQGSERAGAEQAGGTSAVPPLVVAASGGTRIPRAGTLRPGGKGRPAKARGLDTIQHGTDHIDLSALEQLVDSDQTVAIARALDVLARDLDGTVGLREAVEELCARIDADGLDVLSPHRGHPGRLARPRPQEIIGAVNRYRGLRMSAQN